MHTENDRPVEGTVKKMRLVSASSMFGPAPTPETVVEQRITVNSMGRIWFSTYNFYIPTGLKLIKMRHLQIDKDKARQLLDTVASYFRCWEPLPLVCDGGDWLLELTDSNNQVFRYSGSLGYDDMEALSESMRKTLGINNLWGFGYVDDEE